MDSKTCFFLLVAVLESVDYSSAGPVVKSISREVRQAQLEKAAEQSTEYVLPKGKYGDLARFLAIAGATPSPVVRKGGYSGRRRRQAPVPTNNNAIQEQSVEATTEYVLSKGKYGDLSKFLALAGASPSPIVRGGVGYGKRRRRQILVPANVNSAQEQVTEATTEYVLPEGKYGDLTRFLAIAGATSSPVVRGGGGYSGRKKREDERDILTNEIPDSLPVVKEVEGSVKEEDIPASSVKVKTRGNYGLRSFLEATQANEGIFGGRYSREYGKKRQTKKFIPFSVYENDKVETLKVEQNDFLALDQRLKLANIAKLTPDVSPTREEKNVKKRHFSASSS